MQKKEEVEEEMRVKKGWGSKLEVDCKHHKEVNTAKPRKEVGEIDNYGYMEDGQGKELPRKTRKMT